ncbi:MAG: cbb3-type cytochrome oxidase assembly protein CcoS [Planctomycetes bacterium]|nr:cbb3-type cytochrome oxidase assembly protein CcoS [Planctomycetota bacterium]
MSVIYILLPVALFIAAVAVGAFIWAGRRGEFDGLETPAVRMLFDDDPPEPPAREPKRPD